MSRRVRSRSALALLLACAVFALSTEKVLASSIPLVDPSFELADNAAWNAAVAGSTNASGFPISTPPDGTYFMLLVGYPGGGIPSITDGKGGSSSGSVTVVVPHSGPSGELADDDHGDGGKVEKKDDDQGKKDDSKAAKKGDDKNKKTVAKAPAKRAKPTAVESATWGEVKNSQP